MILIDKTDFKGKYEVAQNSFDKLQDYIDRYEPYVLKQLMGETLATDFIADPNDQKWNDLKAIGFGLKSLVVGLVYFYYVRDLPYRPTNQGFVYQLDNNAQQVITSYAVRQRYNECIDDYKAMQRYLHKEFDDFKGTAKKYMID